MGTPVRVKNDRQYTYADYLAWPDEERWEVIDGVAYDVSHAPSLRHQDLSGELQAQIRTQLRGQRCRVFAAPVDVRFSRDERANVVVQPDLLVVCDPAKLDERGVIGAPDWIVEIISPSSASRDQILKCELYEREGVREFWLVHPVDRILTLYHLGDEGRYQMPLMQELKGHTAVAAVPGLSIDWDLWQPGPTPE